APLGQGRSQRRRVPQGDDEADALHAQPGPRVADRMKPGFLFVLVLAAPAAAQTLVDPMRPATAAHVEAETVVARSAGPVLEQIVLSDGGRFAVIAGRRVSVGDKLGDATLVQIGPDQVTLRGETIKVLRLFPGAAKKGAEPQRRKAEEGS